tara:strand:+ start:199 stop:381 length:183 start_codon:yes stop_codon:yes gene_type:complete
MSDKKNKYVINLSMEFKTRPTKSEVESKLFDLLKDGFTLRTPEEQDEYVRAKEIREKKSA